MQFNDLSSRALEIRSKYSKLEKHKFGKEWTTEQIMQGFVGDIGDLMKLVMAKSKIRDIENVDEKLAHELSDCLWSILILANKFNINLEQEFLKTMDQLEDKITRLN